jgi:hypothetical protein
METLSDTPASEPAWTPGLSGRSPGDEAPGRQTAIDEAEVQRLAQTFAVSLTAARLAVARVGTDFHALQRELGGRR